MNIRAEFNPRNFQKRGIEYLMDHPRCNIFAGMGMGKTSMVLNAIDAHILAGESQPTLIVAPLRVARDVWKNEADKWEHLKKLEVMPIVGTEAQRRIAIKRDAPIYTANYEVLPWLAAEYGDSWPFGRIVADESTKLKNHRAHYRISKTGDRILHQSGTLRARALGKIAHTKTRSWWNLTGTPAPNGLLDLWGQCWFIDGGERLGRSFQAFENRWFKKDIYRHTTTPLPHAEKQIREAIADVSLTLRPEDYFDLPELVINTIPVDLPQKARAQYSAMEKKMYIEIEAGGVEAYNAAAKTAKCHQMANGAIYFDSSGGSREWEVLHDAKLEALSDVVEEANGTPVLVVYKFKSDLARLKAAFPKGREFDKKPSTLEAFKSGQTPILFLHPDSAGHGVDGLQYATNILCFFSLDWNLETRAQVIERIGPVRQKQAGFDRPVFIHQIVARDTVDDMAILPAIETKRRIQDCLLNALKHHNTRR